MRRELAALIARSPFGQGAAWPVVETVQVDGICVEVLAPAPDLAPDLADQAQQLALSIADELDVVGLLAVELFETDAGLVVNELAMRPHNSGHWTIDGARTSQFEQHLRAVLDYPLGSTDGARPGHRDGQRARRRRSPRRWASTSGCTTSSPASPPRACTSTARRSAPAARSGTSPCSATTSPWPRRTATLAANWLATARWADGYDIHG